MAGISSCTVSGIISALGEGNDTLRVRALAKLYDGVDQYWAEMAEIVSQVEGLSENAEFSGHRLAAAVASKIFFHLEEYDEALRLALGAGHYFDVSIRSEYVETLVSRCIDKYVAIHGLWDSCQPEADSDLVVNLDPRLEAIVERMFLRCYDDGEFEHAMGIALEAQQIEKIKEIVIRCPNPERTALMSYVTEISCILLKSNTFRINVMRLLIDLHETLDRPNYLFLCHAWQDIGDASEVSKLLLHLVCGSEADVLLSYQLAFNLVDSGNQIFVYDVSRCVTTQSAKMKECESNAEFTISDCKGRIRKLEMILSIEGIFGEIQVNFLISKCATDILILRSIKDAIGGTRSSVLHNALVIAHSVMNAGTTNTTFLRENLDWMGKATNWAKFNATASIGVIHMGHISKSLEILQPYLPASHGRSNSPYSEGGALYALGLVHVNRGESSKSTIVELLRGAIHVRNAAEPLQHGACLGIGLAAMATADIQLYDQLKAVLFFDAAVAGEAAAYGIGLLLAGHGTQTKLSRLATSELLSYAHETAHEKIIRSIVLSLALIVFGQENLAEPIIEQLCRDRDAIIRYGGMYAIGLAYAGTAHYAAVKRLLHVAVSDVSDDVRRAAVMCLGIVLFRTPLRVPTLVALLAESFNPHVRYGACLAIGIACAGTGSSDSLLLLEPMLSDPVDFVRQGCLLALSLIFMQQSEFSAPLVKWFREKIAGIVKDNYPSTLTKLGAIMAAGIVDAGGRNCSISLSSRDGFIRPSACIGIALWTQHWYWYPMLHFLALAFAPSMLIGLNGDFQLPRSFSVFCAAPASNFAYPPRIQEKRETKKERVTTAVLSTTLKQQAREKARERVKDGASLQALGGSRAHVPNTAVKWEQLRKENQGVLGRDMDEFSDGYHFLHNPSRIINAQQPFCSFLLDRRYLPAAKMRPAGIVMLIDQEPTGDSDTFEISRLSLGITRESESPLPFSWPG